jgi:hypothetical protein
LNIATSWQSKLSTTKNEEVAMHKNSLIITAALLFGSALPAAADQRQNEIVPSHRAIQVDEFLPQSGAPGSLVTVRGRGLRQVEYVLVGGYKATAQHNGANELTFRIPKQHGDGRIELYVPGRGNMAVGRFTVFSMLAVQGFSPGSGKGGTQVEIHGQGFQHGDQVLLGNRKLQVLNLSDNRIVVRIPGNATSDYLTVTRHGGVSERSSQRFHVMSDKPSITAVTPQRGRPGTEVHIAGHGFEQGCKVFYGQAKLPVLRWGGASIDVRIPDHAERNEYLYVNCAGEQDRSPYQFQLERRGDHGHPVVDLEDVQPRQGLPGTRVALYGQRLNKVDSVLLGDVSLRIVKRRNNEIEVEIPHGARSASFALHIHGRARPTSFHFQVLHGASIESFSPATARPGHTLSIRGQGFGGDARVLIGGHQATIIDRSAEEIRVSVPRTGAGMQQIRVISGGRQAVAAQALEVRSGAEIWRAAPGRVRAGASVTLHGQGFDQHTRVYWGHHELQVLSRSRNGKRIEVLSPSHARGTQQLSVDDGSGRVQTQAMLEILPQHRYSYGIHGSVELHVN